MQLRPSRVRQRILDDHVRLREELASLEVAVDLLPYEPSRSAEVADVAGRLLAELVMHTELEDAILGPALLEVDAWGTIRERSLLEHHDAQRAQLRELLHSYLRPREDPAQIAALTRAWIREVRADMEREEQDLLVASLLRDDTIAIDMECG